MIRTTLTPTLAVIAALVLTHTPSSALASVAEWPQLGDDFVGSASTTETGNSVALSNDGSILAVSSWEDTSGGPGSVRVYELSLGSWTQKGSTLTGAANGDYFGHALALSADGLTLAVGAPFNSSNRGQVFVYTWNGSAWAAKGATLTGPTTNTQFGFALSLSDNGNVLAVGAPTETTSTGTVYVYRWDAAASPPAWSTPATITGEDTFETFGRALELDADGDALVAGARGNGDGGANSGETRVFSWDGTSWSQQGTDIQGEAAGDRSGHAAAISDDGTVIAIGAPENDGAGANAGHVRIFGWNGTSWAQRGADIDGVAAGDQWGYSVDLSGDALTLAAGSPKRASSTGAIRILTYSSTTWTQSASLAGASVGEEFGSSVALSGTATTLAVGAPLADTSATNSGVVRVFRVSVESTASNATAVSGVPGIYLHVAGPVGRVAEGSPVYYGSDRVAIASTYLLTITNQVSGARSRVLAEGVVDARGNLEARALLPALEPGSYDVVFQGKHRGGAGLRLSARITIGDAGQITTLGPNIPTLW